MLQLGLPGLWKHAAAGELSLKLYERMEAARSRSSTGTCAS